MSGDMRNMYSLLGDKAPVYKKASPTIRFSYVTPPKEDGKDWKDDDVFYADAPIMENENADHNIFAEVSKQHGNHEKPIALYLPGLDGFGISAASWQFNDLSKSFEFWRMTVAIEDRSSFSDLVKAVSNFVDEVASTTGRPVYVIAESFGGLLAPAVSLRLLNREKRGGVKNPIAGLVLVNPATSFDDSYWDVLAPALASLGNNNAAPPPFGLPSLYAVIGSLTLAALIPSSEQNKGISDLILSLDPTRDPIRLADFLGGTLEMFKLTAESLPPGLLEHRISNWMIVGSDLVNPRLHQLDIPTFIVAGRDDKLLASRKEADRLTKILPQSEKLVVTGAGHFVLDENINLTEAILYSKLDPLNFKETSKPYDPILDWKLPPQDAIDEVVNSTVKFLEDSFSPIYISTDNNGKRFMGIDHLPKEEGPLLFVSNHQLSKFHPSSETESISCARARSLA
jgi:pimeloyl-ACP methyl ester carboxylesterase